MKKYEINRVDALKIKLPFYGEFYRRTDADRELLKLNKKVLNLETKLGKQKQQFSGVNLDDFRNYILSGGCASKNVKVYILNLIEAFILSKRDNHEFN